MKVVNTKGLKGKANGKSAGVQGTADAAVLKFLNEQYPADSGKKLEIKHLWESYYRLNYWDRWLHIGKIEAKHCSAVVPYRSDVTRIISVRRSRTEEAALYES